MKIIRCFKKNKKRSIGRSMVLMPVSVNEKIPFPNQCEYADFSSAVQAVLTGDIVYLKNALVIYGADFVNWKSNCCQSLLHFAVRTDNIVSLKWLIENSANVSATDTMLNTVLHYGCRLEAKECVTYILKLFKLMHKNALDDVKVKKGNIDLVKKLLDDPAVDGRTPLHYASTHASTYLVTSLLKTMLLFFEPDEFISAVSRLDCRLHSAAHMACEHDRVEVLKCFVDFRKAQKILGRKWLADKYCQQFHELLQQPDLAGRSLKPRQPSRFDRSSVMPRKNSIRRIFGIKRVGTAHTPTDIELKMMEMKMENQRLRKELEELIVAINGKSAVEQEGIYKNIQSPYFHSQSTPKRQNLNVPGIFFPPPPQIGEPIDTDELKETPKQKIFSDDDENDDSSFDSPQVRFKRDFTDNKFDYANSIGEDW